MVGSHSTWLVSATLLLVGVTEGFTTGSARGVPSLVRMSNADYEYAGEMPEDGEEEMTEEAVASAEEMEETEELSEEEAAQQALQERAMRGVRRPNVQTTNRGYAPYLMTSKSGGYAPFLKSPKRTDNSAPVFSTSSTNVRHDPSRTRGATPNEAQNRKGYSPYLMNASHGSYAPFLSKTAQKDNTLRTNPRHQSIAPNEATNKKGYSPYLTNSSTPGNYSPFTSKLSARDVAEGEIRHNNQEDLSSFAIEGQAFEVSELPPPPAPEPEAAQE